jgi:serine/threonine-protein kinase RsbW
MPDTITLKVSESAYPRMKEYLLATTDKAHFDDHQANRLRLAVEEAVGNIIDYSGATEMTLSADISDGLLSITITDNGKPFNPLAAPKPDLDMPIEDMEPGGLGIMYMRKMSDDLSYQRTDHQNILIIKMRN